MISVTVPAPEWRRQRRGCLQGPDAASCGQKSGKARGVLILTLGLPSSVTMCSFVGNEIGVPRVLLNLTFHKSDELIFRPEPLKGMGNRKSPWKAALRETKVDERREVQRLQFKTAA